MEKLENDEHLAREATARQDILKKVDDSQAGDYQNRVSLSTESEEEYYNGKDETLKNRIKLKNQKEKETDVKSQPDPTAKSQSDETKSLSDDYKPFKAPYKPLKDDEAKRTFPCNTKFDFFNLVNPNSDSSERDSKGTFLKYRVPTSKWFFCAYLINFC